MNKIKYALVCHIILLIFCVSLHLHWCHGLSKRKPLAIQSNVEKQKMHPFIIERTSINYLVSMHFALWDIAKWFHVFQDNQIQLRLLVDFTILIACPICQNGVDTIHTPYQSNCSTNWVAELHLSLTPLAFFCSISQQPIVCSSSTVPYCKVGVGRWMMSYKHFRSIIKMFWGRLGQLCKFIIGITIHRSVRLSTCHLMDLEKS